MRDSRGFALVELLAVIVIMGIIAAIAVPVYGHVMDEYKEDLCEGNRVEMARLYGAYLTIDEIDHSSAAFVEFSLTRMDGEICPVGGELIYVDGVIECSVHVDHGSKDEEDEGNDDDGVPFL